jgi:hypothetical protein
MKAQRKGPMLMRHADLTQTQRCIALACRQEAVSPTIRLRFVTFGIVLAVSVAVGILIGRTT